MILAYVLIYIAVDYGRPSENRFSITDKGWWIQVGLVTAGGVLLYNIQNIIG